MLVIVLETLVDAGMNVFFMSTENLDDSEENGNVAEYWNVDITSTGNTEGDTDEEV